MISALFADEAHRAWLMAERIKRVSDRMVGLGPFGVGLDGLLALAPIPIGGVYSLVAGGWLMLEAFRARAGAWTLARMAAYILFNTASAEVPIIGQTFDFFFRGHLMAANALQKDIVARYGAPDPVAIEAVRRNPFGGLVATPPSPV